MIGCIILSIKESLNTPATEQYRAAHAKLCGLLDGVVSEKKTNMIAGFQLTIAAYVLMKTINTFNLGTTIEDARMMARACEHTPAPAYPLAKYIVEKTTEGDKTLEVAAGIAKLNPNEDDVIDGFEPIYDDTPRFASKFDDTWPFFEKTS